MSIKKTHTQFVKEVEALGKGYTVLGTYVNTRTKIEINCPVHGSFSISPMSLVKGCGCSKCAGTNAPTQKEFEARVIALDKGYTVLGTYKSSTIRVELNCSIHGSFFMRPADLFRGTRGCARCSGLFIPTQAEFEASVIALDKGFTVIGTYDGCNTKVEINCSVHGSFFITPTHLSRGIGCSRCSGMFVPTQEEFVAKVIALGKGYKVLGTYKNNNTKVEILCPVHGSFFITPSSLFHGSGCTKCVGQYVPTQEEFVARVIALGKGYTVLGTYTTALTKVEINCPVHGSFSIAPSALSIGHGCAKCASYGFNPNKPALLYYFEVEGLYKIGITNHKTVDKRYTCKADREKINILMVTRYDTGQEALDAETLIKRTFKEFVFQGDSPLKGVGTSEMFTHDVLGLDV